MGISIISAFLDKYRDALPADVKLYAGGEDNFCHRLIGAQGQLTDFGSLDRRALAARKVATVLCEHPTVIAGHAFTTGQIKRSGVEKILPNTMVEYGIKDGLGCDATKYTHFTAAELQGKVVPDEHTHEHATCFNVKDRGLVVITSCGHVGILNTIRQAQEVSGIKQLHALIAGFHLGRGDARLYGSGRLRVEGVRAGRGRAHALQRPDLRRIPCRRSCRIGCCWPRRRRG